MNKTFARILLIAIITTAIGGTYLDARYRGHRRHHRHRRHGWYRHRPPFYGFSYAIGNIALAHSLANRSDAIRQLIRAVNTQNGTIQMMHKDMQSIKARIRDIEEDLNALQKVWK
jgi:hypothetical protein